jgi:hypothetical protein
MAVRSGPYQENGNRADVAVMISPRLKPSGGVRLRRSSRTLTGTVLVTGAVFGLAVAGTLELKHLGESGVQAERDLQGVATELSMQDALEWRVISGRLSPVDVEQELAESRDRARALISRAGATDADHGVESITTLHDAYARVVDEELRLLAAGSWRRPRTSTRPLSTRRSRRRWRR